MELEQFKARWQQRTATESVQFRHSPEDLTTMLRSVKSSIHKANQKNRYWLIAILVGICICMGGYLNFRFQYTPARFPRLHIQVYDASFLAGIAVILLKLLLSTWWTVYFSSVKTADTTLKTSLQRLSKQFDYLYRISLYGSIGLLPPLFFLELRVLSPLLGWHLHQYWWLNAGYALILALTCIAIGHYFYRKSFERDTRQLRAYLSQLEETQL